MKQRTNKSKLLLITTAVGLLIILLISNKISAHNSVSWWNSRCPSGSGSGFKYTGFLTMPDKGLYTGTTSTNTLNATMVAEHYICNGASYNATGFPQVNTGFVDSKINNMPSQVLFAYQSGKGQVYHQHFGIKLDVSSLSAGTHDLCYAWAGKAVINGSAHETDGVKTCFKVKLTSPPPPPPPPTDLCKNIAGNQSSVPAGYYRDSSGNCYPNPTDLCLNIAGNQSSVPAGYYRDSSGNCYPNQPIDVCPNLPGNQSSVPTGYYLDSSGNCVPLPPPTPSPTIECGTFSTSPSPPNDEAGFTAKPGFVIKNGNSSPSYSYNLTLTITGAPPFTATNPPLAAGGGATTTPNINIPGFPAGTYNGSYSVNVSGVGSVSGCDADITIANKPYVRVYGGDVLAGNGFLDSSSSCSANGSAGILTYNDGNGIGAGTQFAAQAPSAINEFASANLRTTDPQPPTGLTFANTSGTWGGNFQPAQLCAPNYFDITTNSTDPIVGGNYNGDSISDSQHKVIKHTGKVVITGNVTYSGSASWASLEQIPSFYLIVKGDIYIDNDVTNLDGVYIAQGGNIYTCTNGGSLYSGAQLYDSDKCRNKLTVNGALLADQIRFLRVNGNVKDAVANEQSTSGNIAEVINYLPELWLVNPNLTDAPANSYDSLTSLPPAF